MPNKRVGWEKVKVGWRVDTFFVSLCPFLSVCYPTCTFSTLLVYLAPKSTFWGHPCSIFYSISLDVCTFTHTGKNWRYKQNWYHCRTCKLQGNEGVCSICAKVCHANHDILYAKYSSFFCDCGSKGEEFCKALIKEDKGIN